LGEGDWSNSSVRVGFLSRAVAPLLNGVLAGHMISQEALPSGLVTRCLDLLRTLSSSERDLIRVVVEVVHELRDANDDDEVIVRLSSPSPTTESP
jgi:hypothetical protein